MLFGDFFNLSPFDLIIRHHSLRCELGLKPARFKLPPTTWNNFTSATVVSRHKNPKYYEPENDLDLQRLNWAAGVGFLFYALNSDHAYVCRALDIRHHDTRKLQHDVCLGFFLLLDDSLRKIKLRKYNRGDKQTDLLLSLLSLTIESSLMVFMPQLVLPALPEERRVALSALMRLEEKQQHLRSYVEWLLAKYFDNKYFDCEELIINGWDALRWEITRGKEGRMGGKV